MKDEKRMVFALVDERQEDYLLDMEGNVLIFDNPEQVIEYVLANNLPQEHLMVVEITSQIEGE